MIHAFNFCGTRDAELGQLMKHTLFKYCKKLARLEQVNMDQAGYGNGGGWGPSMMKVNHLRQIVSYGIGDDDWVLSVDSDVVFTSTQIFDWVQQVTMLKHYKADIIGIQQVGDLAKTELGLLKNMSGCSIYLRGWVAKKIASMTPDELQTVREEFIAWVLCENEDVVISYLAQRAGAKPLPIPDFMYNGNFELDLVNKDQLKSFYHLNYSPTEFLGQPVSGKWDLPRVLREQNIQL